MNKRLAITAQKAIGKGKLLWLDCYNDAIYDIVSPTLKTTTKSSEMNFIMEQGEINETQIPQQDYSKMKTDKMLNVITLFSGYDSQALALHRLGIPYDLKAWCEIDTNAIKAHDALFPQWKNRNLGDVSKVDWAEWHKQHPQQIDLLTYSSPCQDFSSAGLQRGGEEGSGTRSGLLWETERAVRELRPHHLVFENVGGLVSDKFIDLFNRWQARLNVYGYTNFQQLMNAKDYGVPQNRLRIFMVSILDCPRAYYFPKPFPLTRRLKDVLEQNVDERYYLKDEQVEKLVKSIDSDNDEARCVQVGQLYDKEDNPQNGRIYNPDGLCPSIMANKQGGQREPKIAEPRVEIIADLQPDSQWQGSVRQQNQVVGIEGIAPACTAEHGKHPYKIAEPQMLGWTRNEKGEITDRHPVNVANCVTANKRDNTQNYVMEPNIRIRRLTERELYRLMDLEEKDIDTLLAAPIPRTQHAKLAGNSIVVACLYHIFRNLFVNTEPEAGTQTKLF